MAEDLWAAVKITNGSVITTVPGISAKLRFLLFFFLPRCFLLCRRTGMLISFLIVLTIVAWLVIHITNFSLFGRIRLFVVWLRLVVVVVVICCIIHIVCYAPVGGIPCHVITGVNTFIL